MAGKTGTCSQLGWFASYAPADGPQLVVVVFLRRGSGHGASAVAGRIFRELFGAAGRGRCPQECPSRRAFLGALPGCVQIPRVAPPRNNGATLG